MVLYRWPIMILTLSLVYIFIAPEEPFTFKLFFKLLPMIAIVLYAFRIVPKDKRLVHWFVLLGLIVSIIGDATVHLGLIGLTAFFLAHICYSIGFLSIGKSTKLRMLTSIPSLLYVALFGTSIGLALRGTSYTEFTLPVLAYILIISITLFAAVSSGNKPAIFGALLFVISHSILVWDLFIEPIEYVKAIVMFTYYAAQFLIAVSLYSVVELKRRIVW